eukprot:TRINITY_DN77382_c0_g1_i1.p1 TRINITY_DN77382_c0_g1~~TRINITY_DN77382_c0_g1_i1.p1  ORF type:complete len:129 (+),score=32.76 TRINITY_DN77382_c0_g1_i1:69-455(+)
MDPVQLANLKTFVIQSKYQKSGSEGSLLSRSSSATRCQFEREKLAEGRRRRGKLLFMDRMQADVDGKRAQGQVDGLRQQPEGRKVLDRMVEKLRPPPKQTGPKIVAVSSGLLYDGHDRKADWYPLEFY